MTKNSGMLHPTWVCGIVLIGLLNSLSGCSKKESVSDRAEDPAYRDLQQRLVSIKLDRQSPESFLKSVWAYQDGMAKLNCYPDTSERKQTAEDKFVTSSDKYIDDSFVGISKEVRDYSNSVKTPDECLVSLNQYDRHIDDIEMQGETRRVVTVTIHNVSPIPQGASADQYDQQERAKGSKIRYEFVKTGDEWKIEQVSNFYDFDNSWLPQYSKKDLQPRYPKDAFGFF